MKPLYVSPLQFMNDATEIASKTNIVKGAPQETVNRAYEVLRREAYRRIPMIESLPDTQYNRKIYAFHCVMLAVKMCRDIRLNCSLFLTRYKVEPLDYRGESLGNPVPVYALNVVCLKDMVFKRFKNAQRARVHEHNTQKEYLLYRPDTQWTRLDTLTRHYTSFESFAEMVDHPDTLYQPTIHTTDHIELRLLADAYDLVQELREDPRRAYRPGVTVIKEDDKDNVPCQVCGKQLKPFEGYKVNNKKESVCRECLGSCNTCDECGKYFTKGNSFRYPDGYRRCHTCHEKR